MSVRLASQDIVLADSTACRITACICANALPDRQLTRSQQTAALQACVVLGMLRCKHQQARKGCTSDGIGFKEWRLAQIIRQVLDDENMKRTRSPLTAAWWVRLLERSANSWLLVDVVGTHQWREAVSFGSVVECICCGTKVLRALGLQQLCPDCMRSQVSLLNLFSITAPDYSNKNFWETRHSGELEEWYCGYQPLQTALLQATSTSSCNKCILVPGCGSSPLCIDIHNEKLLDGFSVIGSDISLVSIERLTSEAALSGRPDNGRQLSFMVDDSTCSRMQSGSFDLIVDKGTLDAIATGGDHALAAAVSEYTRLTTANGSILLVTGSSAQSRFGLFAAASGAWTVDLCQEMSHFRILIIRKCGWLVPQLLPCTQEAVERAAQMVRVEGVCALGPALDGEELALCKRITGAVLRDALAPDGAAGFTMRSRGAGRWDVLLGSAGEEIKHKFARHRCWWPVVECVLGDDAQLMFVGVVASYPGAGVQKWHADGPHLFGPGYQLPAHCLNVFVPLQDMMNRALGGTEFCCKSHVIKNVVESWSQLKTMGSTCEVDERDRHTTTDYAAEVISYTPAPPTGHAVVFDYRLLHRGLANTTLNSTRLMLYFTYVKPWYNDRKNFK